MGAVEKKLGERRVELEGPERTWILLTALQTHQEARHKLPGVTCLLTLPAGPQHSIHITRTHSHFVLGHALAFKGSRGKLFQ